MITNKPSSAAPSAAASSSAQPTTCGNCGIEEKRLIHNVWYSGILRRLCTTCVVRLNPQSFCPTCFTVYPPPSSGPNEVVICFKCYSASHSSCVGPNVTAPYICPLCVSPNSKIFNLKKVKNAKIENGAEYRLMDEKAAKVLVAAAKIASISMHKAANAAKEEAVRWAKEASFSRKRAREAMEHTAYLMAKEKSRKKELRGGVRRDDLNLNGRGGNNLNGVVRGQRIGNLGRVDRSNEAVELREGNNKVSNLSVENSVSGSGQPSYVGGVDPMDVEDRPGLRNGGVRDERSGVLDRMENHGGKGKNVSNGGVIIPPGAGEVCKQNHNGSGPSGQRTS